MKLYLATSNAAKIRELKKMIEGEELPLEVGSVDDLGGMPEVVEDQETFAGNALKKARALSKRLPPDGIALADDSGICVDALEGAPGVYSARFAGEGATDEQNLTKLIDALQAVEEGERSAHFACHLAVVDAEGNEKVFVGEIHGTLLGEPRGDGGFGYDPIFVPHGHRRTTAEMSASEKAEISHRGKAMRAFIAWLREQRC